MADFFQPLAGGLSLGGGAVAFDEQAEGALGLGAPSEAYESFGHVGHGFGDGVGGGVFCEQSLELLSGGGGAIFLQMDLSEEQASVVGEGVLGEALQQGGGQDACAGEVAAGVSLAGLGHDVSRSVGNLIRVDQGCQARAAFDFEESSFQCGQLSEQGGALSVLFAESGVDRSTDFCDGAVEGS